LQVPVTPTSVSETYDFGSRSGASVLAFDIREPGAYRIAARYDDGRDQPQAVLAVGYNFMPRLLTIIFGGLAIVFSGIAAAIVVAVMIWRRRTAAVAANNETVRT